MLDKVMNYTEDKKILEAKKENIEKYDNMNKYLEELSKIET